MSEIQIPDWLTEDFLQTSLETDQENFAAISVISFKAEPAVPPGNNFGSNLFRVFIKFKRESNLDEQSVSLIVKSPLTNGIIKSLGEGNKFFYEKELAYYNQFISEKYKLAKHNIVPKHYSSPQPLCLLMEDLKSSGYSMVDRHNLLDYDHCRLYIQASAKLHALSVAVNKTSPDVIQMISKEHSQVHEQIQKMSKSLMMKALLSMAAYLEDKPNCENFTKVINQVTNNFSTFWDIFQQMESQERHFKALVQSDPWCTNMMFKYNKSGKVTDVKLLDFQNVKLSTPAFEFLTFFWLSLKPEVREQKTDNLYHLHCDSFNTNLENLGCEKRLCYEDFKAEIISLSPLVLLLLCVTLPFCIYDGVADINQCLSEDITNKQIKETVVYSLYSGTAFNRYYPHIFKQAEREGVFQYLTDNVK